MNCGLFDKHEEIYVELHWPNLDTLSMRVVKNCPHPQLYIDTLYITG